MRQSLLGALCLALAACAAPGYNPNNAVRSAQDPGHPKMHCPAGSVVQCEMEGGALVGKKYSYCECRWR